MRSDDKLVFDPHNDRPPGPVPESRADAMTEPSPLIAALIGQTVVIDMRSEYVCLGTLAGLDHEYLDVADADLHDLRDSTATREVYIYDSQRLGIRRNRARVLIRRDEVVGITRFSDVAES